MKPCCLIGFITPDTFLQSNELGIRDGVVVVVIVVFGVVDVLVVFTDVVVVVVFAAVVVVTFVVDVVVFNVVVVAARLFLKLFWIAFVSKPRYFFSNSSAFFFYLFI